MAAAAPKLTIEKISEDQARQAGFFRTGSGMDLQPYKEALQDLRPGEFAQINVPENENPRILKWRLGRAAGEMGMSILWGVKHEGEERIIRFQIKSRPAPDGNNGQAARASTSPTPPAPAGRRRR